MEKKKEMSMVVAVVICLILAGILIFITINNKTNMDTNNYNGNIATETGEVAKNGDTVAMNYTGRLADGTVFDSNMDSKFGHAEKFVFSLGAGQVISGWDKGIVGMKVGEKKTLTISPEDAYGANGIPGIIPPNATLIFDVELLSINK
jgi:FKBP-type peptidyl-prolyl cis-trans isomerase